MSLANIKLNNSASRGFTIVELLIVVVVIAILAAITIVSYNGITNRANASAAKSAASTFQKKAELYNGDENINRYPVTAVEISADTGKSWYMPSASITYAADGSSLTQANGKTNIAVRKCGSGTPANQAAVTATNVTGLQIFFFDYDTKLPTTSPVAVGQTTGTGIACPTS